MNKDAFEILLDDGAAHVMGDGLVVVDQVDASAPCGAPGRCNRVVLSRGCLEALLAAMS